MTWQTIDDFSAGIRQAVSANYPAGAAQPDGTWRCYTRGPGILTPLPKRTNNIFLFDPPCEVDNLVNPQFELIGVHARNPLYWAGSTLPGVEQNNTDLLVGVQWWERIQGTVTRRKYRLYRYFRHFQTPMWQTVWTGTVDGDDGVWDARTRPENMDFVTARSNSAAPTVAGPVVTAFCVDGFLRMFPDDTDTYGNSTNDIPGDRDATAGLVRPNMIVGHQSRLVVLPLLLLGAGQFSVWATNEAIYYTDTNDWTNAVDSDGYFRQQIGMEQPTGYQVLESLTFDELLMIKSRGGAVMVRGAITNPQNIRLPYVRSTGMSMNRGTKSPVGFVYPVDSGGLWLWNGGDTSTHLTPDMDPDFWRPPAVDMNGDDCEYGHRASTCDLWGEWVLLPNNWLWDSDSQAMWRIDDPEDILVHRWSVDWRGRHAYGCQSGMRNVGDPAVVEYRIGTAWDNYQWRSQPIPGTIERDLRVRAVKVVGSGAGRFTVNVKTRSDQAGRTVTFDGSDRSAGELWASTARVSVAGSHVVFTVSARAVDEDSPAPDLHQLAFDVDDDVLTTGGVR